MAIVYKLLNHDMTSHGGTRWRVGEWRETDGTGGLCGSGWLHAYEQSEIVGFLNPIHANIKNPVLYQAEADGACLRDHGLKIGYTRMCLVAPMPYQAPTLEQTVRFALACACAVYRDPAYVAWATHWVTGADRTAAGAAEAAWARAAAAAGAAAEAAEARADIDLSVLALWALSQDLEIPAVRR